MKKGILEKLSFNQKTILFVIGLAMSIVSLYLTSHYFDAKYPSGFDATSVCNISGFFNCDATTLSPLGNIAGIPISIFGILIGAMIMLFYVVNNDELESSLFYILNINMAGCVLLFLYSLFVLKSLCPFCSVYYLLSLGALLIFYRFGEIRDFSIKGFAIYAVVTIVVAGISFYSISSFEKKKVAMASQLVTMFNGSPKLGQPTFDSPLRLASASEKFDGAPIQMTIFSDFQCPACKALHKVAENLISRYKGKINIQYFFYPLDHNCNANMQQPLHPLACKAAYISYCSPREKFKDAHDRIFENQADLSDSWLDSLAKENNAVECSQKPETKDFVVKMINEGDKFGVRSTPTSIINGVKIEGVRPLSDYYAIFDSLVK